MRNLHSPSSRNPMARNRTVVAKNTFVIMPATSLERLVLTEIGDGESQGIHRNPRVRHAVPDDENETGDILFAAALDVIRASVVDLFEIDGGLVWRLAEVL